MTDAWKVQFKSWRQPDVQVVTQTFETFMDTHPDISAVVSPGNSFGLMDGGYDKAIVDYFGERVMESVQREIIAEWNGEQPVGTSLPIYFVDGNGGIKTLIHTPTMRTPRKITDYTVVYNCMRSALITASHIGLQSIVIPAFGGATGQVPYFTIAAMMNLAYTQVLNPPDKINWEYAKKLGL